MSNLLQGTLTPGSILGKYTIIREIGRGGMGSVYEARHEELQSQVAIKTLKPEYASQPELVERFLREGRAAARVRHRHAITMFDVGSAGGVVYLAMEYLQGEDLSQRLKRDGAMSVAATVDVLLPVLSAMVEAHDAGIVHRDLKPANIFLATSRRGHVEPKVLDFGISRIASDQGQTATEALLGTPSFMAPEQVRGAKNTTAASDQYSLGVIVYQCVTGALPFRGATAFETFEKITQGSYTRPSALVPGLPAAFEAAVMRALSVHAEHRFSSVSDFALALMPYASPTARGLWEPTFLGAPPGALAPSVAPVTSSNPGSITGASGEVAAPAKPAPAPPANGRLATYAAAAVALAAGASMALGAVWKQRREAAHGATSAHVVAAAPTAAAPAVAAPTSAPVAAPAPVVASSDVPPAQAPSAVVRNDPTHDRHPSGAAGRARRRSSPVPAGAASTSAAGQANLGPTAERDTSGALILP